MILVFSWDFPYLLHDMSFMVISCLDSFCIHFFLLFRLSCSFPISRSCVIAIHLLASRFPPTKDAMLLRFSAIQMLLPKNLGITLKSSYRLCFLIVFNLFFSSDDFVFYADGLFYFFWFPSPLTGTGME